jgi:glutaredoxin-like YruB-family protein
MDKKIIIYGTSTCPYCAMAKDFFDEKKISYEYKDVGADEDAQKEMMQKSGSMGVPVIDIDGKIIVGFDVPAISKELEI